MIYAITDLRGAVLIMMKPTIRCSLIKLLLDIQLTFLLSENRPGMIYRVKGKVIGGAVFGDAGGRLGCLCLGTMEEFYV